MTEFTYDHVHLRSPNPDETAAYYERMFGAKIIKSVMSNGIERTDMNLGGVMVFIAQVSEAADLADKRQLCRARSPRAARPQHRPGLRRAEDERRRVHGRAKDDPPRRPHRLCPGPAKRADRDPRPRRGLT